MKRKLLISVILLNFLLPTFSQVGIGTTTPDACAALQIDSTNKGILIPKMTKVN